MDLVCPPFFHMKRGVDKRSRSSTGGVGRRLVTNEQRREPEIRSNS